MTEGETLTNEELLDLRRTARQVVFRTGVETTPISLSGTVFVLAFRDRFFAITARHVVGTAVPEQLLVATNDYSWIPTRILEQFNPSDENSGELDLTVYDLDVRHFITKHRRLSRAYAFSMAEPSWQALRYESTFFFFGYPLAESIVDYGLHTTKAESRQYYFEASYQGPSSLSHCHELKLRDVCEVVDLNGMSGSPVFSYYRSVGLVGRPMFAGIVLRGSAESGLVHFIGAEVVRAVLMQIFLTPRGRTPNRWRSLKTKKRRSPSEHR